MGGGGKHFCKPTNAPFHCGPHSPLFMPSQALQLPIHTIRSNARLKENRWLVTDEPVEVRDFKGIPDHFRGIYRIHLK